MKRSLIATLFILGVLCSCKKTSTPNANSNLITYSTWKGHVQLYNRDSGIIQFAIGNFPLPEYNTDSVWGTVTTGLYYGNGNQTFQLVGGTCVEGQFTWFQVADPATGIVGTPYQIDNGIEFRGNNFNIAADTIRGTWTRWINQTSSGFTGTWIAVKQ